MNNKHRRNQSSILLCTRIVNMMMMMEGEEEGGGREKKKRKSRLLSSYRLFMPDPLAQKNDFTPNLPRTVSMESLCRYNIERILFPRVCEAGNVRVSITLIRNSRDRVLFETMMISFFFFKRSLRRVGRRSTVAGYYRSIRCTTYTFSLLCERFFLSHDSPQKFAVRKNLHAQILLSFPHVGNFLAFTPRWSTTTGKTTLLLPSSRGLALFLRRWKIRRVSKARHIKRSK